MSDADKLWHFRDADGKEFGPYQAAELIHFAKVGRLTSETMLRSISLTKGQWVRIDKIPKLHSALTAPIAPVVSIEPKVVSDSKPPAPPSLPSRQLVSDVRPRSKTGLVVGIALASVGITAIAAVVLFVLNRNTRSISGPQQTIVAATPNAATGSVAKAPAVSNQPQQTVAPKPLVPFSISGLRIGDPLTPEMEQHVPQRDLNNNELRAFKTVTVGSTEVQISYMYLDRRLESVFLAFESKHFETLLESFVAKFGKPDVINEDEVTTRMNVKFKNVVCTWKTDSGDFTLTRFDGNITDGTGHLFSQRALAHTQRKQDEEKKELRDQL